MNIPGLSDQSLMDLHSLIAECLVKDDAAPQPKPWGVRDHPDWRIQADQFEAELASRKLSFAPIKW